MTAVFSIHYDGPMTMMHDGNNHFNHTVSIRVLANTYEHMQRAIDRAFLINEYGTVYKHARLKKDQYPKTDFIAIYPKEGGIILDAIRSGSEAITDRIYQAIKPVFDKALQGGIASHDALQAQLSERKDYINAMQDRTPTFRQVLENPDPTWAQAYSNRSITKEIDQLANQITQDSSPNNTLEITLIGHNTHLPLIFTPQLAKRFHSVTAGKELGAAMIVPIRIRSLDIGNRTSAPKAKILNTHTNREVTLKLTNEQDFFDLHPLHNGQECYIYASPIIESLGFDLQGGDLMYLKVAN